MPHDFKNVHSVGSIEFVALVHDLDHASFDIRSALVARVNVGRTLLCRILNVTVVRKVVVGVKTCKLGDDRNANISPHPSVQPIAASYVPVSSPNIMFPMGHTSTLSSK